MQTVTTPCPDERGLVWLRLRARHRLPTCSRGLLLGSLLDEEWELAAYSASARSWVQVMAPPPAQVLAVQALLTDGVPAPPLCDRANRHFASAPSEGPLYASARAYCTERERAVREPPTCRR